MSTWFLVSIGGMIAIIPLYFLSLEHLKLQERFGKQRGTRIAETSGLISGWGFFSFWLGIWISPQPRFTLPLLEVFALAIPGIDFSIPLLHGVLAILFIVPGAWFGIGGTKETSLKVAETHRAEKIVTTGVYSIVRHPQYFGGTLAHVGMTFLFSAGYSLLSTPIILGLVYIISRKEESELLREFGAEYENYKNKVPMLIPRAGIKEKLS